jgi:exosortase
MRSTLQGPVAPQGFRGSFKHGLPLTRATQNNLAISALVGAVVGLSPFTTGRLSVSIVLGTVAAATLFGVREFTRRRADAGEEVAQTPIRVPLLPPSFLVAMMLFGILFWPTLVWLYAKSTVSIWTNGHGIFTPFIMGYLGHQVLSRDDDPEPDASLWGLPIVALGICFVLLDLVPGTHHIASLGLVICLPGLSLLFLGVRRTRMLALPLALAFFLIPIPDVGGVHLTLQDLTTTGTVPLLRSFGYAVARYANVLVLPDYTIHVSAGCSGFSALYAGIFLTVILVAYTESTARRAILILAVLPVALISNVLRVFALVLLVKYTGPEALETVLHSASGAVSFWVVIGALVLIAGRPTLRKLFA